MGAYTITASATGYHLKSESNVEAIACETSRVDFGLIPIIVSPPGGNWIELDGIDDFAFADDSTSLDVGDEPDEDLTIEAWVYPKTFPSVNNSAVIVSKPGAYELSLIKKSIYYMSGFRFVVHGEGADASVSSASAEYKLAAWYHIAVVFDNSANTITLYINGEQKSECSGVDYNLNNSPRQFYVGGPPPLDGEYFDGLIDEIRVSDVVRYSADFTTPSEPFTPDANTRALWHFDEPIGSTSFEDSSGNNNTLTGVNGAHIGGEFSAGDVSGDRRVTAYDVSLVLQHVVGIITLSPEQQEAADVTGDYNVTALDTALILQYTVGLIAQFPVESIVAAPVLDTQSEENALMKIISQLEATDLNREQQQILKQLKKLVFKTPIPKHTVLLQNYPNPFNPETWIPFKLAQNEDVTINIYNVKGQLIRTLHVGDKKAGVYMTKNKAVYWDGQNATGEAVSSGIYFYRLQVGEFSATRKMVIVK